MNIELDERVRDMYPHSVWGSFEGIAKKVPDKPALIFLGSSFSYSQLRLLTERFAAGLVESGVKRGERAIIYLPNSPQWIIAWLALLRIGVVPIPITPISTTSDLRYLANDCKAETIVCMDTNFGYVNQVLPETSLQRVVVTSITDLLPSWKKFIGKAFSRVPEGKFSLSNNVFAFKRILKGKPSSSPSIGSDDNQIFGMFYSSGTTGLQKGVPISEALFWDSVNWQRKAREALIPMGKDIVVLGFPLFYVLGQVIGLGSILQGDTVILFPKVNLDGILGLIQVHKATSLFGSPAFYQMTLGHQRLNCYDLSSLKYCFSGGDILFSETAGKWLQKFGKPIYQGYGDTETCGSVSIILAGEPFPTGTAGKIMPFQKIKVVDPDTLAVVTTGEQGELLVSSEHMVRTYWNKPEESTRCFLNIDGNLWYRTKDLVHVDKDGWLFFLDRAIDTIKHQGKRVSASKIEAILQENPAVVTSCAMGIPDEKSGERIKAFVVLKEGVRGISASDLINWCRERLFSYEVPQYIEFRDILPRSKTGKLLRRELRAEEQRKQVS